MVAGKTALPHKVETQQQASLYLHLRKYLYILFLVHKRNIGAVFYDGFVRIIASFYEKSCMQPNGKVRSGAAFAISLCNIQ